MHTTLGRVMTRAATYSYASCTKHFTQHCRGKLLNRIGKAYALTQRLIHHIACRWLQKFVLTKLSHLTLKSRSPSSMAGIKTFSSKRLQPILRDVKVLDSLRKAPLRVLMNWPDGQLKVPGSARHKQGRGPSKVRSKVSNNVCSKISYFFQPRIDNACRLYCSSQPCALQCPWRTTICPALHTLTCRS